MKTIMARYGLTTPFHVGERKSVDIFFSGSGRLRRIIIPLEFGLNFADVLVEVDRADRVPMVLISGASGLAFREDSDPIMCNGKVVCFDCGKLNCKNDEHDHVQNFNILRGTPSFIYEHGYILRLTATAIADSSFMVVVSGVESATCSEN